MDRVEFSRGIDSPSDGRAEEFFDESTTKCLLSTTTLLLFDPQLIGGALAVKQRKIEKVKDRN